MLDATAEFSYSPQQRKNIVLSTLIKDMSRGSVENTTWTFGISQLASNLDVSLNGHSGKDGSKCTYGLGVEYQTVRRQKKNLLLLGEIDRLRKQISVDVSLFVS